MVRVNIGGVKYWGINIDEKYSGEIKILTPVQICQSSIL